MTNSPGFSRWPADSSELSVCWERSQCHAVYRRRFRRVTGGRRRSAQSTPAETEEVAWSAASRVRRALGCQTPSSNDRKAQSRKSDAGCQEVDGALDGRVYPSQSVHGFSPKWRQGCKHVGKCDRNVARRGLNRDACENINSCFRPLMSAVVACDRDFYLLLVAFQACRCPCPFDQNAFEP
jgi:hypothetical protein